MRKKILGNPLFFLPLTLAISLCWGLSPVICLIKAPPHSSVRPNLAQRNSKRRNFLNNWPIFNPKLPLESSGPNLYHLAIAPGTSIRQITVYNFCGLSKNYICSYYVINQRKLTKYMYVQLLMAENLPLVFWCHFQQSLLLVVIWLCWWVRCGLNETGGL